jgi:opacity protein-like surface antigen
MRSKILLVLFTLACSAALFVAHAQEPQDPNEEDGARGTFMKSRPEGGGSGSIGGGNSGGGVTGSFRPESTPKPVARATPRPTAKATPRQTTASNRPKPGKTPTKTNTGGQTAGNNPTKTNTGGGDPAFVNVKLDPSSIGLGYSVFQRNKNDEPVRVDPSNEFRSGDQLRFWFEPNADGYLYIFNTTNNGKPTLVYPDSNLNGGNNKVRSHYPFELPSADNPPQYRWFSFYGSAGTEQLYVVLTKEPLAGLPTGAALAGYCKNRTNSDGVCEPDAKLWASVKAFDQQDQVVVAKNTKEVGQVQAKAERPSETNSRGFGMVRNEPAPTVVFMNASADRSVLFAKIEFIHK